MTKLNRSETEIVEREKKKIQKKRGGRFKKIEGERKSLEIFCLVTEER